jgi:hypothetical protein
VSPVPDSRRKSVTQKWRQEKTAAFSFNALDALDSRMTVLEGKGDAKQIQSERGSEKKEEGEKSGGLGCALLRSLSEPSSPLRSFQPVTWRLEKSPGCNNGPKGPKSAVPRE